MSNCVQFETPRIYFRPTEIDISALMVEVEKHADHEQFVTNGYSRTCGMNDDEQNICRVFWWYLNPKNVYVKECMLDVLLESGRSSHTWRSLEATLIVLNRFVLVDKEFALRCKDESDGFMKLFPMRLKFGKNVKPGEHAKG